MLTDTPETPTDESTTHRPAGEGGFLFKPREQGHEVTANYSWRYADSLIADRRGIQRIDDSDGYYANDEAYHCHCGEELDSKSEAERHLRRVVMSRLPPVPETPFEPRTLEREEPICDGAVTIRIGRAKYWAEVLDGIDFLVATARETYQPPARYQFDSWEPLTAGRLQHGGEPIFDPKSLAKVLRWLTDDMGYRPERYTIHFRGAKSLCIEGNGKAALVTPQKEHW